jgi:RNA-directed DNA polymerase
MMHRRQKSDLGVVAQKLTNKPGRPEAESVERRPGTKGNMVGLHTHRTQGRVSVSQRLDRVRQAARQRKKERFTALFHHVDTDLLRESFFWLQRKAGIGAQRIARGTWRAHLDTAITAVASVQRSHPDLQASSVND